MQNFLKNVKSNLTRNAYKGDMSVVLLVIIGVIIFSFMIGYFKNHTSSLFSFGTNSQNQQIKKSAISGLSQEEIDRATFYNQSNCGVVFDSPFFGNVINFPQTFSGYTTGCGWGSQNGTIGQLQIFDGNGRPLSAPIQIQSQSSDTNNQNVYFSQSVSLFTSITTPTGYILIISTVDGNPIRIPISFQ